MNQKPYITLDVFLGPFCMVGLMELSVESLRGSPMEGPGRLGSGVAFFSMVCVRAERFVTGAEKRAMTSRLGVAFLFNKIRYQ